MTKQSLAARILLAALLAAPAAAQEPEPLARGDKGAGEEEQIAAREAWLRLSRGLEAIAQPNRRRAAAIEAVRAAARSVPEFDPFWRPIGPESMTMLNWTMGKVAGRVAALAVDPRDENVLYLGAASGGLWKSYDGGASWSPRFDDVGTPSIGAIHLQPDNPEIVWVGTGEQGQSCTSYFGLGLFRSTDGGGSWVPRNGSGGGALQLSYVSAIAVHPTNPLLVLAGGHGWCDGGTYLAGGVFRSTDGGESWSEVLAGPASDLFFDAANPARLYAAIGRWGYAGDGLYRSTDSGATWNRLENGVPFGTAVRRMRLAQSPADPQTLFALINPSSGSTGLYRSTDGGASWALRHGNACEGQCGYNLVHALHPTDTQRLLVGSIRFAQSTNAGSTLTYLTTGWGSGQKVHQDTHVLVYSLANPSRFWVGSDGGLWRSDDGGSSFVNLNANLQITQFYDVAIRPGEPQMVFGGAQDNSSLGRFDRQLWDVTVVTGDGFVNLVDPTDGQRVFQTSYPSSSRPSVVRSSSGGAPGTFSWLGTTGIVAGPFPWVTPLAIAAVPASGYAMVFVASNAAYRARADQASPSGFTWTPISGDLTGGSGSVSVLAAQPAGGTIALWAGTASGRIQRAADALAGSVSWSDVTGNFPGGYVSDLAVDAADPLRAFATRGAFGGAKLYRTTAGGVTWTAVGAGLPDLPANSVAIDPADGQRLFVGTDAGVFESLDGGVSFTPLATGMPLGAVVTDLEVDAATRTLVAGTYGNGAWALDLAGELGFRDGFEGGSTARWSAANP